MKRMLASLLVLLLCPCLALGEVAGPRTEAGRQVAAYMDSEGINYILDTSTEEDVFVRAYPASQIEGVEGIPVAAYVDDDSIDIMSGDLVTADTSDMAALYQGLEAINEDAIFVRFICRPDDGGIYARMELPIVGDGDLGYVVEQYLSIVAQMIDVSYAALAALA